MLSAGASVIHNPESNMKLGAGIAPVRRMLERGLKVGIGTDGAASNNDLALFKEMDAAAKLQKLAAHNTSALTAYQTLRLATIDGARALGMEKEIGSLEAGKAADVIAIDLRHAHMRPLHDLMSQLVYAATGQEVTTVICDGKVVVENSRVLTLDLERTLADADRMRDLIQSTLAAG